MTAANPWNARKERETFCIRLKLLHRLVSPNTDFVIMESYDPGAFRLQKNPRENNSVLVGESVSTRGSVDAIMRARL